MRHIAGILQVTVEFLFEGAPGQRKGAGEAPTPDYVAEYLATPNGLALTRAFMRIKRKKVRRKIVDLVRTIADVRNK